MTFLRHTQLIFMRNVRRTLREPAWIMIGMFQPVLYLLLFAPLLDNLVLPGYGDTSSLNIFVPGLLVMIALFGLGFAGFGILDDLRNGVIERFRVTSASRLALLLGMILHDVVVFLLQCAVLVVVATLMGFRADIVGLVVLFGLLALVGLMVAAFSYALGLIFRDESSLAASLSTLTLPLLLLSGVLLPLSLAPELLQTIADFNPFLHIVEAARALIHGDMGHNSIAIAYGVVFVMMLLTMQWAISLFRRATA
ncbi:MAG: ABC transporter permease [Chloroflexi bacterium]|nr:ABC transporter permease [Chloroflexota bacterium]